MADYPEIMKTRVARNSAAQGLASSRLPTFTEEEKAYIKGTSDFFGLNNYTTRYARAIPEDSSGPPSYTKDLGVETWQDENWPKTGSVWLRVVPWGIRWLLKWIYDQYHVPIYITENGVTTPDVFELDDEQRQKFHRAYINEVLKGSRHFRFSSLLPRSLFNVKPRNQGDFREVDSRRRGYLVTVTGSTWQLRDVHVPGYVYTC